MSAPHRGQFKIWSSSCRWWYMLDNEGDVEGWLDAAVFTTRISKCEAEVGV